jgi:hypothetical protein
MIAKIVDFGREEEAAAFDGPVPRLPALRYG